MQKNSLSTKDYPIEVQSRVSRKEKHRSSIKLLIFKYPFKILEGILTIVRLIVVFRDLLK
ncbi:hypothetical protein D1872_105670 [compost metagenome]